MLTAKLTVTKTWMPVTILNTSLSLEAAVVCAMTWYLALLRRVNVYHLALVSVAIVTVTFTATYNFQVCSNFTNKLISLS